MSDKSGANVTVGKMELPTDRASNSKIDAAVGNNVDVKLTQQVQHDAEEKKDGYREDEQTSSSPSPPNSTTVNPAALAARKATLQDLTKFGPGDKTNVKFAVLIGLIEIGQVSNKEVVNTVLQLVRTINFLFFKCRHFKVITIPNNNVASFQCKQLKLSLY